MKKILKWLGVLLLVLVVFGVASAAIYYNRHLIGQWLNLVEKPVVVDKTPTFVPMKRFVTSIDNGKTLNYLVLDYSIGSYKPDNYNRYMEIETITQGVLLQHFSARTYDNVRGVLKDIPVLQNTIRQEFIDALRSQGYSDLDIDILLITKVLVQ